MVGWPPSIPAVYWPRTVSRATRIGVHGLIASITLAFSARTASASKALGGSMAVTASSWNMWFGTMSRSAPVGS